MTPTINPEPDTPATPRSLAAEVLTGCLHDYLQKSNDPQALAEALADDLDAAGLLNPAATLPQGVGMEGPGPFLGYQVQCRLLTGPYWSDCRGAFCLTHSKATSLHAKLSKRYPGYAHRIVTLSVLPTP